MGPSSSSISRPGGASDVVIEALPLSSWRPWGDATRAGWGRHHLLRVMPGPAPGREARGGHPRLQPALPVEAPDPPAGPAERPTALTALEAHLDSQQVARVVYGAILGLA